MEHQQRDLLAVGLHLRHVLKQHVGIGACVSHSLGQALEGGIVALAQVGGEGGGRGVTQKAVEDHGCGGARRGGIAAVAHIAAQCRCGLVGR